MKIVIIRTTPENVRIGRGVYNLQEVGLAKALTKAGHVCDIIFWTDKEEYTDTILCASGGTILVMYKQGRAILKNAIYKNIDVILGKYDVIQLEEYNQYESWRIAKKYPSKVIIYHGPYECKFNKRYNLMSKVFDMFFLKRYQRLNTHFITKSYLAEEFLKKRQISYVRTIGVGLDQEALEDADEISEDEFFGQLNYYSKEQLLLYIGQIQPRRNISFLFELLVELKKRGRVMYLVMIGDGAPFFVDKCFSYARQLGVYDQIIWKTSMEQRFLARVYLKCQLFVLPTIYEIFGMVLLESMYYGTIPITTINGGSLMLIKDHENGIIMEDFSVVGWCDIIEELLKDTALYNRCAKNGKRRISNQFTWDAMVTEFICEYSKIIDFQ